MTLTLNEMKSYVYEKGWKTSFNNKDDLATYVITEFNDTHIATIQIADMIRKALGQLETTLTLLTLKMPSIHPKLSNPFWTTLATLLNHVLNPTGCFFTSENPMPTRSSST